MSRPRMTPKQFPFAGDDTPELQDAIKFLRKWKQDIDDRLFREGYEMRDGKLYKLHSNTPVDLDTYWRRRRENDLSH